MVIDVSSSVPKIHTGFKNYRRKLRHEWEEFCFIRFYEDRLHKEIKSSNFPPLEFVPFMAPETMKRATSRENSMSILGQVMRNSIKHRVVLDGIGAFENYLCDLAETVLLDYPSKLKTKQEYMSEQDFKLINVVIDSNDKDEILSRIVEEKIRSIFYGNPTDFFLKDKAKLEFRDHFKSDAKELVTEYSEIVARRNIIVHNAGRIDRKYILESGLSGLKLGNKLPLDYAYLKRMMCVLEWLAAHATDRTIQNVYQAQARGKLAESLNSYSLFFESTA